MTVLTKLPRLELVRLLRKEATAKRVREYHKRPEVKERERKRWRENYRKLREGYLAAKKAGLVE